MRSFKSRYTTLLFLSVLCFSILYTIYGRILVAPNSYLLSDKGEAMRSYYVMTYHLINDSTWLNFNGMNYPYGELLTYCDGQPATTIGAKSVAQVFPSIKNYGVGYMNVISLYSLILSAILLFLILLEFNVSQWMALLIALSIMLLTPQVMRMKWQPALATSCFIPLSFYLFVKWKKYALFKWKLLLAFNTLFWYFIHPYLGLMLTCFLIVSFGVNRILLKTPFHAKEFFWQLGQTVLPTLVFLLSMNVMDGHGPRVESPLGIVQFSAYVDVIVTSPHSPFAALYLSLFGTDLNQFYQHFEGAAYIGIVGSLALIAFLVVRIFFGKRISGPLSMTPISLKIIGWTSILLLIFAFALPFKWFPSTIDWLDAAPPLKQFRALGRFSWFFVYALHLCIGYGFFYWYSNSADTKKKMIGALFVGLIGITCWEGVSLQKFAAEESNTINVLNENVERSTQEKKSVEVALNGNYQAIVPIPYIHIGSHRFEPKSHFNAVFLKDFFVFSKRTGLPTTASFLSRNAVRESINAMQFFSSPLIPKQIQADFTSGKKLLLFCSKELSISAEEQRVVNLGRVVFENERYRLIEVTPKEVFKNESKGYLQAFKEHRDAYYHNGQCFVNNGAWATQIMTKNEHTTGFFGSGLVIKPSGNETIFDQKYDVSDSLEGNAMLSFWMEHNDQRTNLELKMRVTDRKTGRLIEIIDLKWGLKTFDIIGDWMLCEFEIVLNKDKRMEIYTEPKSDARIERLYVDEIMLRSVNSSVFEQKSKGVWWWNNRPLAIDGTGD